MRLFKVIGFIVGALLGFLVFNYEYGGAGGGGQWYKVYIGGVDVLHVGGYFADLCLGVMRVLFSAVMGIAGFLIGRRIGIEIEKRDVQE